MRRERRGGVGGGEMREREGWERRLGNELRYHAVREGGEGKKREKDERVLCVQRVNVGWKIRAWCGCGHCSGLLCEWGGGVDSFVECWGEEEEEERKRGNGESV